MDQTETTVVAITCVLLGGLCLIALYIAIRRRCFRYQELPDADPSNKLWVGSNPTDAVEEEPDLIPFDLEVATERNRKYVRLASNFCRSLSHERQISQLLPFVGPRDTKFYCLVNDALVDREEKQQLNVLMTMINGLVGSASGDNVGNWPDFTTSKYQSRFKRLLCALNHPYVLPTYDVAFALDNRTVFFLRPWSAEGSLRDAIFEQRDPTKPFYEKYPQRPTPTVRAAATPTSGRRGSKALQFGRGLRLEKIAKYGRQILEGLKYFESLALPYYHLHSGNVVLFNGAARLTDYENAYFGFHNRLHKKMKKLPIDPTLSSFGCLLYEMATGFEVPTPRKGRVELNITDPSLDGVVDVLNKIFHTTDHTVTLDEIASHRLFQVGVTVPSYPKDRPDRIAVESKMQKMLAPIVHYYVEKLYRKDDDKDSVSIKVASPSARSGGDGSEVLSTSPGTPVGSLPKSSSYSSSSRARSSKKDKKKSKRRARDDSDDDGDGDDGNDERKAASPTMAAAAASASDDKKERLLPTAEELAIDVPSNVSPPPAPPLANDDEL